MNGASLCREYPKQKCRGRTTEVTEPVIYKYKYNESIFFFLQILTLVREFHTSLHVGYMSNSWTQQQERVTA